MNDQDKNSSLIALVAGVVIGAGVTYLFTTKEGQKIKDKLIEQGTKLFDDIKGTLEDQSEVAREQIEEAVEHKLEEAKETLEEVPQHIDQIQKKGRRLFFRKHAPHTSPES